MNDKKIEIDATIETKGTVTTEADIESTTKSESETKPEPTTETAAEPTAEPKPAEPVAATPTEIPADQPTQPVPNQSPTVLNPNDTTTQSPQDPNAPLDPNQAAAEAAVGTTPSGEPAGAPADISQESPTGNQGGKVTKPKKLSLNERKANNNAKLGEHAGKINDLLKKKQIGKELAKQIGKLIGQLLNKLWIWLIGLVGWPVVGGCCIVVFLIVITSIGLFAAASKGIIAGKSYPTLAPKDSVEVKDALALGDKAAQSSQGVAVTEHQNLELNAVDTQAVADGKIDKRLLTALKYLSDKHLSLGISHIISDYQYMTGESGSDSNPKITKNVSAHKQGTAADLFTIDFIYKVLESNDVVYYSDEKIVETSEEPAETPEESDPTNYGTELLRLKDRSSGDDLVKNFKPNTKWKVKRGDNDPVEYDAEAVPIKVEWQDEKPLNTPYVAADAKNDCLTHQTTHDDDIAKKICEEVFRPEAQRKVHQVITELLQFPYDSGNVSTYRVVQIITFSYERDVAPFTEQIAALYGQYHSSNFGLFQMPEAWAQVHIAY